MRRFVDSDGRAWDVVIGRESWGALYALFVPSGGGPDDDAVRQAMLDADSYTDAQILLGKLEEGELAELLDRSTPKER